MNEQQEEALPIEPGEVMRREHYERMVRDAAHKPHGRTAARIANINKLVDALRSGPLMRDEIGALLQFTPSGVRKYIKELRELSLIELVRYVDGTPTFLGHPEFQLNKNAAYVAQFMAELDSGTPGRQRSCLGNPSKLEVAQRDPNRHFHVMADDTYFAIRVNRMPVMRDPMVAALFGAPRAQ